MEDNENDNRSISEGLRLDFTVEMSSSCLGDMQRLAEEANRMDEERMEIDNINEIEAEIVEYDSNEVVISAGSDMSANASDEFSEDVTDEASSVSDESSEGMADEASNMGKESSEDDTYVASSISDGSFTDTTDEDADASDESFEAVKDEDANSSNKLHEASSVSDESLEAVSDEDADVSDESPKGATDEATIGNKAEASARREEIESRAAKKNCVKLRRFLSDETYFFVIDLIEAVEENQKEHEENSPEQKDRQQSYPFYFSDVHKYHILKFVNSNENDFISVIKEHTPTDHFWVFETCKDQFIERYKPKTFSGIEFIKFCAAIAYLGFYCSTRGLDPSANKKATSYICSLIYDVVQRNLLGKLDWLRM